MKNTRRWIPWMLCIGFAAVTGAWILLSSGALTSGDPHRLWSALSNAFCLPGAVLLCLGLLGIAERHGQFDMLGYGMKNLSLLFSSRKKQSGRESFFDYKERRQALRKGSNGSASIISGLVCMALAILFMILYLNS